MSEQAQTGGVELHVHFAKPVSEAAELERRHALAGDVRHLDRYAQERGLKPLGDFLSYTAEEYGEDADDEADTGPDWYDAHDVQHAAEAMARMAVDDPPGFVERAGKTTELIAELNNIATLCRRAAEQHTAVRLTVGA